MSALHQIARQITEEMFPNRLSVGLVCNHPDGYRCKIISGEFWGERGVSNFWYWRKVNKKGRPYGKELCGYGWDPKEAK